jgi:dTDP-4-amino-4,6-dideoxygalactose transaminase
MALTNDAGLAARLERLRSHGITRDPALMDRAHDGPWYYQQIELGWNYRHDRHAGGAGPLASCRSMETYVARRHELARRYDASWPTCRWSRPGRARTHIRRCTSTRSRWIRHAAR